MLFFAVFARNPSPFVALTLSALFKILAVPAQTTASSITLHPVPSWHYGVSKNENIYCGFWNNRALIISAQLQGAWPIKESSHAHAGEGIRITRWPAPYATNGTIAHHRSTQISNITVKLIPPFAPECLAMPPCKGSGYSKHPRCFFWMWSASTHSLKS